MNNKRLLIIGIIGVIVLAVLLALVFGLGKSKPVVSNVTLQFWGVFDAPKAFQDVISGYESKHGNVRIIYKQIAFENYEKTLIDAFAAGTGPDIWMIQNTWLPKHGDKIISLSEVTKNQETPLYTFQQYRDLFVDVALQDLTKNQIVYAYPLYLDTLALFYNKDLFNSAHIAVPPRTWDEFNQDVAMLTVRDNQGNIIRSAIPMGTARNINRSTDILMMLMLQSRVQMNDPAVGNATFSRQVQDASGSYINAAQIALQYFLQFADQSRTDRYTWNYQQKYSIDAFADGNAAMMFNYSHTIATIRDKAPHLNFGIAPVPQPKDAPTAVTFPSYWGVTVSKQSARPLEAWDFITYLTTTDATATYVNAANRPAARRDYLDQQKKDLDLGVFATQALTAKSWYQPENVAVENIFADMIDKINFHQATLAGALQEAESKVNVLFGSLPQF